MSDLNPLHAQLEFQSTVTGNLQEEGMEQPTDIQKSGTKKARIFDITTLDRVPVADSSDSV